MDFFFTIYILKGNGVTGRYGPLFHPFQAAQLSAPDGPQACLTALTPSFLLLSIVLSLPSHLLPVLPHTASDHLPSYSNNNYHYSSK